MDEDIQQHIEEPGEDEAVFTVSGPPEVAPGVYQAVVMKVRKHTYDDKVTGERRSIFVWQFSVDTNGPDMLPIEGTTSTATGPMSKAYGWLVALVGAERVKTGYSPTPRDLEGLPCLVTVGIKDDGWPKVEAVTAMPKTKNARPAAQD